MYLYWTSSRYIPSTIQVHVQVHYKYIKGLYRYITSTCKYMYRYITSTYKYMYRYITSTYKYMYRYITGTYMIQVHLQVHYITVLLAPSALNSARYLKWTVEFTVDNEYSYHFITRHFTYRSRLFLPHDDINHLV